MDSIKPRLLHGQTDQYTHHYKNGIGWHRNDSFVDETGHATDLIAEAVRFIAAPRSKYSSCGLPSVFSSPQEEDVGCAYSSSIKNPSRRRYAASVTHMDAAIGRITTALENAGSSKPRFSLRATTVVRSTT
jgi:hypothetical protein